MNCFGYLVYFLIIVRLILLLFKFLFGLCIWKWGGNCLIKRFSFCCSFFMFEYCVGLLSFWKWCIILLMIIVSFLCKIRKRVGVGLWKGLVGGKLRVGL